MKCKHTDCFTCPFPDCILDEYDGTPRGKSVNYERNKKYYQEHREEIKRKNREKYQRRKHEQLRMDDKPKSK